MILTQKGSLRFICRSVIFPLSLSFVYSIWRLGSFFGQQEDEGMLLSCCIYRFDIYFGVSSQKPQVFPCLSSLHHSPWVIFCFPPRQTVSFLHKIMGAWYLGCNQEAALGRSLSQRWALSLENLKRNWNSKRQITFVKLRFSGALFLSFLYLWSTH